MVGTDTRVTGRLVALFVAGAILTACSGGNAEPSTTTTPPTTVATTTTTSTTTTTTSTTSTTTTSEASTTTTIDPLARPDVLVSNPNRDSIDDFDTTGDNPYLIAMELRDLFVFLEGHPTTSAAEMMDLMFEADYPYFDSISAGFRELTENPGWHYSDLGVETLGIALISHEEETFTVEIADQRELQTISDTENHIVKTYDGWNRRISEFTYSRGNDGLWRYSGASESRPIDDSDLADMVPVDWTGRR
jgi:hypothetical protein